MIDSQALRKVYGTTALMCVGITFVPIMLLFVGWFMYSQDPKTPDGPGSGTLPLIRMVVFGVLAVSPLLTVPLVRSLWRRIPLTVSRVGGMQQTPESLMSSRAITEYALWEIASLMGFVGFFMGAPWAYFIGALIFTFVGYAFSFPRWSSWLERADEVDGQTAVGPIEPS